MMPSADLGGPAMSVAKLEIGFRARRWPILATLVVATLMAFPKSGSTKDVAVGDISVTVDMHTTDIELDAKVGALFSQVLLEDNGPCRGAAIVAAQVAVGQAAIYRRALELLKVTADAIRDGAKIAGAGSVAKVAQLCGTIVESFQMEDPYQALGQAVVEETVGWASGKVKSGSGAVDKAVKKRAEDAKSHLVKALFGGTNRTATTTSTQVGACTVFVTSELQFPAADQKGGLRLFVSGDCECKHLGGNAFEPRMNQLRDVKLGRFLLIAFLPLERLDASVSFGGTPVDIKKLVASADKLRKAINQALGREKADDKPLDLNEVFKDLQGQVKTASTVKASLTIRPVFAERLQIEEFKVECGKCSAPPATTTSQQFDPCPPGTPARRALDHVKRKIADLQRQLDETRDKWLAARDELGTAERNAAVAQDQEKDKLEADQRAVRDLRSELEQSNRRIERARQDEKNALLIADSAAGEERRKYQEQARQLRLEAIRLEAELPKIRRRLVEAERRLAARVAGAAEAATATSAMRRLDEARKTEAALRDRIAELEQDIATVTHDALVEAAAADRWTDTDYIGLQLCLPQYFPVERTRRAFSEDKIKSARRELECGTAETRRGGPGMVPRMDDVSRKLDGVGCR